MNVQVKVSPEIIQNTLCSAFEGGSNYWYRIEDYVKPKSLKVRSDKKQVFKHLDYPMNEGGAVIIKDMEGGKIYHLTLKQIEEGLKSMSEKHPRHFGDMLNENGDGDTGDVFLQCCLFGDTVYAYHPLHRGRKRVGKHHYDDPRSRRSLGSLDCYPC